VKFLISDQIPWTRNPASVLKKTGAGRSGPPGGLMTND